jgi:ketose-bisphosphate aldolase
MITTLTEILAQAEEGGYAVIAPDFTSLRVARVMVEQAEEMRAPLILSYSTAFKSFMGVSSYAKFIQIVRDEIQAASVPICLHLDHAVEIEEILEAVDVGFTSVMIDASREPWEVNLECTTEVVEIARPHGVSVEAELGKIIMGVGYYSQEEVEETLTDPVQAEEFVKLTGIDALAVAIGNVHGAYQGKPKIDFKRLQEMNERVEVPLVLHGSSGIGSRNLSRSIQLGIRKINLYSEIIREMHTNMIQALQKNPMDPVSVAKAQESGVKMVLAKYLKMSGSVNSIGS